MGIMQRVLVSRGERKVHGVLTRYCDHFAILPKVRFFDVIEWNTPGMSGAEHRYLQSTHFDFLVCENDSDLKPLFAVEFDGLGADRYTLDPFGPLKTQTKTRICRQERFPLLWIDWDEIEDIGHETILDGILQQYILYRDRPDLIESGVYDREGAPVHIFRPRLQLEEKYRDALLLGNATLENFTVNEEWIGATRTIEVITADGKIAISRHVAMQVLQFPFIHQLELIIDLATTRCLQTLDSAVEQGSIRLPPKRPSLHVIL